MARKKNLSHNERAAKANRLRESGQPGGGQGRKDEVGRSGVYPMSEPHAPRPVEIRTAGAWGQGEHGAPGYEDHGSSELTYEGGQVLGAHETHGDSLAASRRPAMSKFRPRSGSHFLTASAGSTRAGWPTSRSHKAMRSRLKSGIAGWKASVPITSVRAMRFTSRSAAVMAATSHTQSKIR